MQEMHSKRPKEACALRCSLKTPLASFSISPPTSQILPSTPFLIENPDILLKWFMEVETKLFIVQILYKPLDALMLVHWQVIGHCPIPLLLFHVKFSLTIINFY